jgi:c-di-GMP-binding flagellar brake protein YcgR
MSFPSERRRHARVAIRQIVELSSATNIGDTKAMTQNLSMGGVLLVTHGSVTEGSEVSLRLALPSDIGKGGGLCFLCHGRVVRRVESPKTAMIAIEFTSYDVVLKDQAR